MHQALPPPLPPPYGMGPIYWSHMRSSPSPPVVWWGCGTVPLPPLWCGDGSHILVPYEIFPLPPCGVVGVWHCPPPPPVVWWMGPIYWSHMRSSPSPPVVWWGCGTVPPPCGVVGVWYGGYVWCVWSVWYGMFGKYGMFGMYGRYGMYGMSGWYCMDGRYGM